MRWPRVLTAVTGLVTLVIALPACGSAVEADDWAGRVCSALSPWRAEITDLNSRAQTQMAGASTPAETRESLLALLAGAETATQAALTAVDQAGTPDVAGGETVARGFVTVLEQARDAYTKARTRLEALPTDDPAVFYDGVVTLMSTLNAEYTASGVDVVKLESPELRRAFEESDQCR